MGEGQAEREWKEEWQGRQQSKLSYQICLAGKLRRSFPTPQWAGPARQEGQGQTEKDRERRCKEAGGNGIFSCAPDKFRQVFVVCRSQTDQSSDADRQRQRLQLQQKQQLRQRQRQRKSQLQLIARWIYQLKPVGESAPMRFGFASLFTAPSTHLSFSPFSLFIHLHYFFVLF